MKMFDIIPKFESNELTVVIASSSTLKQKCNLKLTFRLLAAKVFAFSTSEDNDQTAHDLHCLPSSQQLLLYKL